jgi:succinate-semialdehyde dehydrogenase/glutarate-semialdehyde dehydrogenase
MDPKLLDPALLRTDAHVAGKWIAADSHATYPVRDPATGAELARVPRLGATETRRAVDAAAAAQPAWRAHTANERAVLLRRFAALLVENEADLAMLITREEGKPLAESRGEVTYAASFLDWFAEQGRRAHGETIPAHRRDVRIVVTKQPIGVGAAITPWNFPAAMITRKIAPALAAGCCVVVKPAEATPLSALALAELGVRAGLPPGVLNVVTGDRDDAAAIGGELTSNPIVRCVSLPAPRPSASC